MAVLVVILRVILVEERGEVRGDAPHSLHQGGVGDIRLVQVSVPPTVERSPLAAAALLVVDSARAGIDHFKTPPAAAPTARVRVLIISKHSPHR
jgi:hypothetical protein